MSAVDVDVDALEALLLNSGVAPERVRHLLDALLDASGAGAGSWEAGIPPTSAEALEATLFALRRDSRLSADSLRFTFTNFRTEASVYQQVLAHGQRRIMLLLLAIFVALLAVIVLLVFDPFARENTCGAAAVDTIDAALGSPMVRSPSVEGL